MTQEQQAALDQLFTRYGSRQQEAQQTVNIYLTDAAKLFDLDRVARAEQDAQKQIARLQELIAGLEAFRLACAERYAYLSTAPTLPGIHLLRRKNYYNNKVFYILATFRQNPETGDILPGESRRYEGKQRWEAIKAYKEYIRQHPGVIAETNIEL